MLHKGLLSLFRQGATSLFGFVASCVLSALMLGGLPNAVRADDTASLHGAVSAQGYSSTGDDIYCNFGESVSGNINPEYPINTVDLYAVCTLYSYILNGSPHFPGGSDGVVLVTKDFCQMDYNVEQWVEPWSFGLGSYSIPSVLAQIRSTYGSGVTGFHATVDWYAKFSDGTYVSFHITDGKYQDSY